MQQQSDSVDQLATALAKAQGALKPAAFNRTNPHFRNRYADLASVLEAIRGPLASNGLSVTQATTLADGALVLVTTLRHASGQWCASTYPLPLGAKPQELGSALTYARRYALSALVCLAADEDDDGEATRTSSGAQPASAPVPAMREPVGFGDWWARAEYLADNTGIEALVAHWRAASRDIRAFVDATCRAKWDGLKADAEKVTAPKPVDVEDMKDRLRKFVTPEPVADETEPF